MKFSSEKIKKQLALAALLGIIFVLIVGIGAILTAGEIRVYERIVFIPLAALSLCAIVAFRFPKRPVGYLFAGFYTLIFHIIFEGTNPSLFLFFLLYFFAAVLGFLFGTFMRKIA